MAKTFLTAHIKLEDTEWVSLGRHAENLDLTTAQLIRKVLRGWLNSQVLTSVTDKGTGITEIDTLQHAGRHTGFDPLPQVEFSEEVLA